MRRPTQIICAACLAAALPIAGCAAAPRAQQPAQDSTTFVESGDLQQGEQSQQAAEDNGAKHPQQKKAQGKKAASGLSGAMKAAKADVAKLAVPYGKKARVFVASTGDDGSFGINAGRKTAAASLIKLAVLAEVMREVDDGELSWSGTASSGSSIEHLAAKMIEESDNEAANVLIDTVGMGAVNERCKALGLTDTRLNRKMLASGEENTTSAQDAAKILLGIANHKIASKASCKKAEGFLKAQTRRYGIPSAIEGEVVIGNKTGELNNAGYDSVLGSGVIVRHDAAIIYTPTPVVVCVLTAGIDEAEAHALMGKIGEAVVSDLS